MQIKLKQAINVVLYLFHSVIFVITYYPFKEDTLHQNVANNTNYSKPYFYYIFLCKKCKINLLI